VHRGSHGDPGGESVGTKAFEDLKAQDVPEIIYITWKRVN